MPKKKSYSTISNIKVLCIGVESPKNTIENITSYYNEFLKLCETNSIENYIAHFLKLRKIDSAYFFTSGKCAELKIFFEENKCEEIIISEQLSGLQKRNLATFFNCRVFDRTDLIISIFEKSAKTAEGKLQVQIAKLKHEKTKMAGHGLFLDQQASGIGAKGAGDSLKEITKRRINDEIEKYKKRLEKIVILNATKRKNRIKNEVKQIALIGYTNSGKSTLLNGLTRSTVYAEDKLFATLDTTTKKLFFNNKFIGLLSDTVGFIQNLPHELIEAFKSTLSELEFAALLLCVIDISDTNWKNHINIILELLNELEIKKNLVFVFNKSDLITKEELKAKLTEFGLFAPFIVTSIKNKKSYLELKKLISKKIK